MKIERISDNQIKCTLNRSDLASRQLKMSELAYGTDKAKDLFQDMMDQAAAELDFDVNNLPLMVEAIPVSIDCVVLMVTKIEDPEDVDTDFAGFSPLTQTDDEQEPPLDFVEELAGIFRDDMPDGEFAFPNNSKDNATLKSDKTSKEQMFSFDSLESVIEYAHHLGSFSGTSSLYKSPEGGRYHLILASAAGNAADFSRACNLATEYGSREPLGFAGSAFIDEHYEKILGVRAIQSLANV